MKRGTIVLAAHGKPRPALIIQRDNYDATTHVMVVPLTSLLRDDLPDLRIDIEPDEMNGMVVPSQAMIDQCFPLRRERIRSLVGRVDPRTLREIEQALLILLGFG